MDDGERAHGLSESEGSAISPGRPERFIEITVKDTGIGVKSDDLGRIFKTFEQTENSASRRYQGTGLGLSLTKSLVELHGGTIWVESKGEGKRSSFKFVIPMR